MSVQRGLSIKLSTFSMSSTIKLVGLRALTFAYCLILSVFRPDLHHDGYILASAVAVADGLAPHSGAFSQYGPITPLITGLFLSLTTSTVFSMRILAGIIMFLISIILEKLLTNMQISLSLARAIALNWVFTNHVVATIFPAANLLWPSLIATLLLLVACLLVTFGQETSKNFYFQAISGAFLSLAFFTRIQFFLVVPTIMILQILFRRKLRELSGLYIGTLMCTLGIVIYLTFTSSITDYFSQVIVWPLKTYPELGAENNYNIFLFILFITLPALLILVFIVVERALPQIYTSKFFALLFGLGTWLVSVFSGVLLASKENTYLRLIVGDQFNRILVWPFYFCLLVTVLVGFIQLANRNAPLLSFRQSPPPFTVVLSIGLVASTAVYPKPDVSHIWWVVPLLVPSTLITLKRINLNSLKIARFVTTFTFAGIIASFSFFNQDWTANDYKPLKFTFSPQSAKSATEVYLPLSEFLEGKKAIFLCKDGIHAIASGEYSSSDQWFVSWGPSADSETLKKRVQESDALIVCDETMSSVSELAAAFNLKIVSFNQNSELGSSRSLAILSRSN